MSTRSAFVRWLAGPAGGMVMGGVWLVFLGYPLFFLWGLGDTPQRWIGLGALVVFVPIYLMTMRELGCFLEGPGRRAQLGRIAIVVAVIGILAWAIGPAAVTMIPFLTGITAYGLWPPLRLPATAAVLALGLIAVALTGWHVGRLVPIAIGALVGAMGLLSSLTVEHYSAAADAEQERAVVEQRERLARDVHDLVGHSLTVANLQLQLAERLFDADPERARDQVRQTRDLLHATHNEIRRAMSHEQRRDIHHELAQVSGALEASGVAVTVVGGPPQDAGPIGLVLGWVLRESATNVLRHAQAAEVVVTFGEREFRLADDGVGPGQGEGAGLRGMAERVAAAGGEFWFGPRRPRGSEVRVSW